MAFEAWDYRASSGWTTGADLTGYKVHAVDGDIGKVDAATYETGSSYMVVDTGPWIFGQKVLLPAGVIQRVDTDENKVYVDRTKDQIKSAPEYDPDRVSDPIYRDKFGGYYGGTYGPGTGAQGSFDSNDRA